MTERKVKCTLFMLTDPLFKKTFSNTGITFALKVFNQGLAFLLSVLLARFLDPENFGLYMVAFAWLQIFALFARFGMDMAAIRYIPKYEDNDPAKLRQFIWLSSLFIGITSIFLALSGWGWLQTSNGDKASIFAISFAALPFFGLLGFFEAALRAFGKPVKGIITDTFIRPGLQIGILIIFWFFRSSPVLGVIDAAWTLLFSYVAVWFLSTFWLLKTLPTISLDQKRTLPPIKADLKEWLSYGFFMLLMAGGSMMIKQTDIIMLGTLQDPTIAGIYAVATKISMLAAFGLTACNMVVAPMISRSYHQNKKKELQNILLHSARLSLLLSFVLIIGILFFSPFLLSIFGDIYRDNAALPLYVLLAAQSANALCGPVGYLMALTGHQKQASKILLSASLLNILLNYILITHFGILGAAIATAIATVVWNLIMLVYTLKIMRMNPTAIVITLSFSSPK